MGRKIFLAISGALLLVGIALSIVGYALGGGNEVMNVGYRSWVVDKWLGRDSSYAVSRVENTDVISRVVSAEKNVETLYKGEQFETDKAVINLDVRLHVGTLEIKRGDSFKVENNGGDSYLTVIGQDGDWTVEQGQHNISLGSFSGYKYVITLPEKIQELKLNCSAGKIEVDGLELFALDVDVEAGGVKINNVICDYSNFNIAAGALDGKNIVSGVMAIDCEAGAADISCEVRQELNVSVSAGGVSVKMKKPAEYSWNINTELGSVRLDNMRYSGLNQTGSGGEGEPHISLDCSIGSIDVKFK